MSDSGIQRLRKLGITTDLKDWYFEKVLSVNDIENLKFYTWKRIHPSIQINSQIIAGTDHDRYNNGTWIEMLGGLKHDIYYGGERMAAIIRDYSLDGKVIRKYGNTYIIDQGSHRLCIGKFMELDNIQVDIIEYEFNHELFRISTDLKALGLPSTFKEAENTIVWKITLGNTQLEIHSSGLTEKFIEYYINQSLQRKDHLAYIWNNYHTGQTKSILYSKAINDMNDFKKIRKQIIAFKHNLPAL